MTYLQLPTEVLSHLSRMSGAQVAIWADAWTWEQQGGKAYRTNAQLAEMLGITVKSVSCAITNLRKAGYLEWTMVNGRQRILKATIPLNVNPPVERKASRSTSIPSDVNTASRPTYTQHPVERKGCIPSDVNQVDNTVNQVVEQIVEKEETEPQRMRRLIEEKEARERGEQPQVQKAVVTIPARGAARPAVVSNKAKPFDAEEVRDYFVQLGDPDPDEAYNFWDHFESNGWLVSGKTPMRDWKASVRRWMRSEFRKPRKKSVGERVREIMERETK
jgi:DNA-binding Lrp family transcriptional regulator